MSVLLDLIEPGLKTLFCGSAASTTSARQKAYYAGPGNRFWSILQQTCMTPRLFEPKEYKLLADLGIGLTDLAKHEFGMDEDLSTAAYDVQGLIEKVENAKPHILAFTGKRPAGIFLLEALGAGITNYGEQKSSIGDTRIFVLPSPSGAARRWWSSEPWHTLATTHKTLREKG